MLRTTGSPRVIVRLNETRDKPFGSDCCTILSARVFFFLIRLLLLFFHPQVNLTKILSK